MARTRRPARSRRSWTATRCGAVAIGDLDGDVGARPEYRQGLRHGGQGDVAGPHPLRGVERDRIALACRQPLGDRVEHVVGSGDLAVPCRPRLKPGAGVVGSDIDDQGVGPVRDLFQMLAEAEEAAPFNKLGHAQRQDVTPVSYTHLRAHETDSYLVCRLLLEKT